MNSGSGFSGIAKVLQDQGSFVFSMAVGMLVIAFYARKRIEELINPPKGDEYSFIRSLPMDTIVGEVSFYKAYIIYVLMLEFLYFFICAFKPLFFLIAGDSAGAAFGGAAWPLGAALLVVGLLPSTPIATQIETMLRGMAQRIANIPTEFFNRVSRLSRSDVENFLDRAADYSPESQAYRRINNLLICLSFAPDEARLIARSCISTDLFAQWTISRGGSIWSAAEYILYKDLIAELQTKINPLLSKIAALVEKGWNSEDVRSIARLYNINKHSRIIKIEEFKETQSKIEELKETLSDDSKENLERLAVEWRNISGECDLAARKLCTLFAIIARNDKEANRRLTMTDSESKKAGAPRPDIILRKVLQIMNANPEEPDWWSEAAATAILAGFAVSTIALGIYIFMVDLAVGDCPAWVYAPNPVCQFEPSLQLLTSDFRIAIGYMVSFGLSFGFASFVALFLRSLKREDHSWNKFDNFYTFRISNYFGMFGWCSMAAFMPLIVNYVLAYYTSEAGIVEFSKFTPQQVLSALFFQFIFGWTAVAYGIATCVVADRLQADAVAVASSSDDIPSRQQGEEAGNQAQPRNEVAERKADSGDRTEARWPLAGTLLLLVSAVIFICFIVLLANPIVDMSRRFFWTNMFSIAVLATISLMVFSISFHAFQRRSESA